MSTFVDTAREGDMCNILYLCVGKGYLQLDSPYYNVWFVWLFILLREYLHWACSGVWFVFVLCRLSPGRYTNGITLQWSSKFHYIHGPLSFFCLFLFQLGNKKKENKKRKKKSDSCNHLCSVFLQLQQGKTTRQMFFLFGTCIILNANMLYNFEPGPYKNPPLTVSRLHLLK